MCPIHLLAASQSVITITGQLTGWNHKHINLTIGGTGPTQETHRNPRKTDWEAYRADLEYSLKGMK
ncbi:hypothetical protein NQ318_010965 [Aromia moschata]|uniref:Uncharacterized protein n=1 Tax=Aromia moschata TaxID=1265417 RepID=A0AAV8YN39_9CUCU|nr:hypothetical protein NQ318_010965 [Aromia moschata]